MIPSNAPRAATWLLKHFGCSPKNDSLTGDLIEQYQDRRSRSWFWGQVVVAIMTEFLSELRAHKLLALRAVAIGWSVPVLYGEVIQPFVTEMLWRLEPRMVIQHPSFYHFYYRQLERFFWGELSGGFNIAAFLAVQCVLGCLSGWLVARLHRGNSRPMVLALAVSIPLYAMSVLIFLLVSQRMTQLVSPMLLIFWLAALLSVLGVLIGGGLLSDPKQSVDMPATRV
jgi:hypothetical protein